MITVIQIRRALTSIIKNFLMAGKTPTRREIATALRAAVPVPGGPVFTVDAQTDGELIDADRYNAVWLSLAEDLATLYEGTYTAVANVSKTAEVTVAQSAAISAAAWMLEEALSSLDLSDTSVARIHETFHTNQHIDLTSVDGVQRTTAYVDYTNGRVSLPIDTHTYQPIPASAIQVDGIAVVGTERPLRFSPLSRLLDPIDHHAWMTQVVGAGGGASYALTLTFDEPTELSALDIELTHAQTIELAVQLPDGSWQMLSGPLNGAGVYTAIRIVLTRATGIVLPDGNFLYTFGIRRLAIGDQRYQLRAQLTTQPRTLERSNEHFSRITLTTAQDVPTGSALRYLLTLTHTDTTTGVVSAVSDAQGAAITNRAITPGVPLLVAQATAAVADVSATSTDTSIASVPLKLATFSGNIVRSLQAQGNGLFVGDGQWCVDGYEYDWSYQQDHLPGPHDWSPLPSGVFQEEVARAYVSMARGTDYTVSDRFDFVTGWLYDTGTGGFTDPFRLQAGMTYRFTTSVYSSDAFSVVSQNRTARQGDPRTTALMGDCGDGSMPALLSLVDYASGSAGFTPSGSGIVIAPYMNGMPLSRTADGLLWSFKAGWNTIDIYIMCPARLDDGTVPDSPDGPITLGISLSPAEFPGATFQSVLSGVVAPDYDLDAAGAMRTSISAVRAVRDALELVSRFDLTYNTPILYLRRAAAELRQTDAGPVTDCYFPAERTARAVIRYDSQPSGAWNTTDVYAATLVVHLSTSPATPSVRPTLSSYTLLVE